MKTLIKVVAILALSVSGVVEAQAADYYVSTSGSDGNTGAQTAPFLTITHALSVAGAGDTVYVRTGVYGAVRFTHGGAAGQPLTLRNFPGEQPVIEGNLGTEHAKHSIMVKNGSGYWLPIGWIVIQGLEVRYGLDNIKVYNIHDSAIRDNYIHTAWSQGILGSALRTVIERNVISDNGWREPAVWFNRLHGLYLSGTDILVQNNLFYRNLSRGIKISGRAFDAAKFPSPAYSSAENWIIRYNTFALNKNGAGIIVGGEGTSPVNIAVSNNIFYENANQSPWQHPNGVNFYQQSGGQLHSVRGNIFYGQRDPIHENEPNSYFESDSIYADPQLVDKLIAILMLQRSRLYHRWGSCSTEPCTSPGKLSFANLPRPYP